MAPPQTKEKLTMAEAEEFAEIVAKRLLDQGDQLRRDLMERVAGIQTQVELMRQRADACSDACNRRICALEQDAKSHEQEHKSVTGKLIALLLAALSSAAAALWAVFRERP
jgi:ATP/maltotriose-dependent transcriptional regulator MalT